MEMPQEKRVAIVRNMSRKSGQSSRQWYRRKIFFRFVRIIFAAGSMVLGFFLAYFEWNALFRIGLTGTVVLWDLIGLANHGTAQAFALSIAATVVEVLFALSSYVALALLLSEVIHISTGDFDISLPVGIFLCTITTFCWITFTIINSWFAYRLIRIGPQMRQQYRKGVPIIVFTATGDPVAVIPYPQFPATLNTGTISMDSLLDSS
ncbi:hypothetical protein F4779DRAFT_561576 [Xylariaceae sp. FL0662B]|nr:hypothetical protein F4779DRAFT_561576 [Xylariaceae sp. FL0662B]